MDVANYAGDVVTESKQDTNMSVWVITSKTNQFCPSTLEHNYDFEPKVSEQSVKNYIVVSQVI